MSIQFLLGATGTGKTMYALQEMMKTNHLNFNVSTDNMTCFYIVPEQYTLQAQEELLAFQGTNGLLNIEVLSFNRLVYRFFDEIGFVNRKALNDTGKSMLIRKILESNFDDFIWIKKHRKKQSYMEELNTLVTECYQYNITPEELLRIEEQITVQQLKDKLKDLSKLLGFFQESMKETYYTSLDGSLGLIQVLSKKKLLTNTRIIIDGFYGFTPLQYQLIESIIVQAPQVYFCITVPKTEKIANLRNESDLYYESKKTISKIKDIATLSHVIEEEPLFFDTIQRHKIDALKHLIENLYSYPIVPFTQTTNAIRLLEAATIEQEIELVALRIHQLITTKKCRFKDVVVLTSELSSYEKKVTEIFSSYEFSFFIDEKESVTEHPLIQFLLSLILVIQYNFRYEHVFYHLKSIYYEEIDEIQRIENYVLKFGIKGIKGYESQFAQLNEEKELLFSKIIRCYHQFKSGKTIQEKTKALYEYMASIDVFGIHQHLGKLFEEENELQKAMKYYKVYDLVIDLFDEMVELIGEEAISIKDYAGLLETGLTQIRLGQTPPSVDQILVGDMSRSRFKENKYIFILGVNEGKVPYVHSSHQLITDYERTTLLELGLEIAPNQAKSLYKEQMNSYMALTKSSKFLHVSYPRQDNDSKLRPATLFMILKKMFPQVKVEQAKELLQSFFKPTKLYPTFNNFMRLASGNDYKRYQNEILLMYNFFTKAYNDKVDIRLNPQILIKGIDYSNRAMNIDINDGVEMVSSVSELESYASCPYNHFLSYRLKVHERDEYVITLPDIGILFHKCLEIYVKNCVLRQIDISDIDASLRDSLIEASIQEALGNERHRIFESSYRNQYLIKKLTRILRRALWGIERQLKQSLFRPKDMEYTFDGKENNLNSLVLKVGINKNMFLKGVVDRVDEYETDEELYISIIDYKSSTKDIELNLVNAGIQLQLFVYLNVVTEIKENQTAKKVVPSGLYYYKIQDPFILIENDKEDSVDNEILKQLKPKGLLLHDEEIIRYFDQKLEGTSMVVPVTMSSTGISKASSTILQEDLQNVLTYVQTKAAQLGENIEKGNLSISPYKYESQTSCDYCKYKSICRFDTTNSDEGFRIIRKIQEEEIIEKMKGELNGRSH